MTYSLCKNKYSAHYLAPSPHSVEYPATRKPLGAPLTVFYLFNAVRFMARSATPHAKKASVARLEEKMPSDSSSLSSVPPSDAQFLSPSSFYTAKAAASPVTDGDITNISSPAEAPDKLLYRDARQLPHELKEHCQIHLEERLCKSPDVLPATSIS